MKTWPLSSVLLLLACGPAPDPAVEAEAAPQPPSRPQPATSGPARMLPFPADRSAAAAAANRRAAREALADAAVLHRCTDGGALCARLSREGDRWHLDLVERPSQGGAERRVRFSPAGRDAPFASLWFDLWPHLIRESGGAVMVGLLSHRRNSFSGGGSSTDRLSLIRLEPGAAVAVEALQVPIRGSAIVRACFGEEDMRLRREACHDEYAFDASLSLEPGAGSPRLRYTTRARTYPGRAFRLTDAEMAERERRPFRRFDLVWAEDGTCSYRRTFAFDVHAERYAPDDPLPDCGDYLIPQDDS
jgi:hypothetical protein